MAKVLKKLNVGDINAFERYRKEERKKELIAITREVYGDKIPEGEVFRIEREIQTTKGITDNPDVTIDEIQFLIWRSMMKSEPDITLDEVGEELDSESMGEMLSSILPSADKVPVTKAKKKTVRKKKVKNN